MDEMREFFNVSETAKTMIKSLGVVILILLAGGLLITSFVYSFEKPAPYVIGLLTGGLLSMFKVILLERSLNRSVEMGAKSAQGYVGLQAILRYLLTIAVFLLVVFFPVAFGLFGTILGVLSLQLSAYITGFMMRK